MIIKRDTYFCNDPVINYCSSEKMSMILPLDKSHASQVADLHYRYIHSLLSDLGYRVCRVFYERVICSSNNFGFVDIEGPRIRGFTLGTVDNSRLFGGIWMYAEILLALAFRPRLLKRILFHFNQPFAPAPEALYEAVDPAFRRQGIASRLYTALHARFREKGVPFYEVRIDADNIANLTARQKMGARVEEKFQEDGIHRFRLVVKLEDNGQ